MGMTMNIPCSCDRANNYHRAAMIGKIPCALCEPGGPTFQSFAGLRSHVELKHCDVVETVVQFFAAKRIQEEEEMGKSIADVKSERGIGGPPMLRGQDIPKSVNKVKIKIKELREAPSSFKSPFIIDLAEPVHEREAFAVNITNLRALAELVGLDPETADVDVLANKVKGKSFDLYVSMTNNPSSNKMVRSLFFSANGA